MKKVYRVIMTAVLVLFGTTLRAQTFYQVTFTMPDDDTEYIGLMIYQDDENCKLRLVSEEELEENSCYQADYMCVVEEKKKRDDVGVMFYTPVDDSSGMPTFIWYWVTSDYSDMSELPDVCFDIDDEESWFQATSFDEVQLSDMDEDYILQFYGEGEPEYEMMMNGINTVKAQAKSVPVTPQGISDGPKMYLIVTANTEVSDIGPACRVDMTRIKNEFAGVAGALELSLDTHVIAGENYNKEELQRSLEEVTPGEDDVVVFVYSGHGFRFKDQEDYYPCLDLSPSAYAKATENYVMLTDVFNAIAEKGARLNIVLSDCCNSEVEETLPLLNTNSLFSRANTNFDKAKLKTLFLEASGNVVATAASPGEVSWCGNNGGFFTLSFIESLRSQISALSTGQPSWDVLIQNAIDAAASKSENNSNCKRQNGMKYVQMKSDSKS